MGAPCAETTGKVQMPRTVQGLAACLTRCSLLCVSHTRDLRDPITSKDTSESVTSSWLTLGWSCPPWVSVSLSVS